MRSGGMGCSVAATTQFYRCNKLFFPHTIIDDRSRTPVLSQNPWRRREWKWRIVKASSSEEDKKADQGASSCREIRVCVNKACTRSGSRETLTFITGLAPPNVKVESCGCLGHCGSGPNLVVLPAEIFVSHCSTASHAAHLLAIQCGASDPENNLIALSLKEQGNKLFESGNIVRAEQLFSQAINLNPSGGQHFLYSNRSAVRLAMGDNVSSLADAKEASRITPNWHVESQLVVDISSLDCNDSPYLTLTSSTPQNKKIKIDNSLMKRDIEPEMLHLEVECHSRDAKKPVFSLNLSTIWEGAYTAFPRPFRRFADSRFFQLCISSYMHHRPQGRKFGRGMLQFSGDELDSHYAKQTQFSHSHGKRWHCLKPELKHVVEEKCLQNGMEMAT